MGRGKNMGKTQELLPGTLDLLILRTLVRDSMHGYGIAQRLKQLSDDVLLVGESGVGKECFARLLHHLSPRRDHPSPSLAHEEFHEAFAAVVPFTPGLTPALAPGFTPLLAPVPAWLRLLRGAT